MLTVPFGSVAGLTVIAEALVVPEYAREPVESAASIAFIVKLNAPAVVGVPLITPVEAFNVNPAGNAPAETL